MAELSLLMIKSELVRASSVVRVQILVSLVIAFCLLLLALQLVFPIRGFTLNPQLVPLKACPCNTSSSTGEAPWPAAAAAAAIASTSEGEEDGEEPAVKFRFQAHGSAAALFVEMAAHRGGPATFAVVGLASKPAIVFGEAGFGCSWIPAGELGDEPPEISGVAWTMLPDWGFGRVYTAVVVNCTFPHAVGSDGAGGSLVLTASHGKHDPRPPERFTALTEAAGRYDASVFQLAPGASYPYEHLYCGSPLYGLLGPQRVREWLAYHAWLFGPRSHFVLYDAGGVDAEVRQVLDPWVKQGRVTVHDVRQQEAFDGYYHNQFLIVNDCLFRTRFLANWTFFFDLDEYLYVNPATTLQDVLRKHSGSTQLFFSQVPMGAGFCADRDAAGIQSESAHPVSRKQWAFEKQVYKSLMKRRLDRKYAVQARSVYSAGVHLSENLDGNSTVVHPTQMRYYHYHGTITNTGDICSNYSSVVHRTTTVWRGKEPLRYDASMALLAPIVREFEEQAIGLQPSPVE